MAKPTLNKLKLVQKESIKTITFNEQEIEIKQYLPIQDKLTLISEVLGLAAAADENKFYNPGKIELFFAVKVIEYYTNISITDKQKENPTKIYDDIISSGLYKEIFAAIPEDDIGFVYNVMKESIKQIYDYQNSAYGILDALNSDYKNLNFDVEKIMGDIQNKEGLEFLNEVMTKLG